MQNFRREAFLFTQKPKQKMLGADVFVVQTFCFFSTVSQNALALMAQGEVDRSGNLLPNRRVAFNLFSDGINRGMRPEKPVSKLLIFPEQTEKKVLCLDVRAAKLAGFVPGEEYYTPRLFRISLKHVV
jgi:hypothetical protein